MGAGNYGRKTNDANRYRIYPFCNWCPCHFQRVNLHGFANKMTNPIQTKRIEMADKRKGKGIFYFSGSKAGRISWADWFYIREKRK